MQLSRSPDNIDRQFKDCGWLTLITVENQFKDGFLIKKIGTKKMYGLSHTKMKHNLTQSILLSLLTFYTLCLLVLEIKKKKKTKTLRI